jgi:hypothetical protein
MQEMGGDEIVGKRSRGLLHQSLETKLNAHSAHHALLVRWGGGGVNYGNALDIT